MTVLLGSFGRAHQVIHRPEDFKRPDEMATIGTWLLTLPGHPIWAQYVLFGIHLRDIPGQSKPAEILVPGATHQVFVLALNPEVGPFTPENLVERSQVPGWFLLPGNISEQLGPAEDSELVQLLQSVARAMVNGVLPAEPQGIHGAREYWRKTLLKTLEHFRTGHFSHLQRILDTLGTMTTPDGPDRQGRP